MKVVLAGYNVDVETMKQCKKGTILTPETISAAYARISRSPKSVDALRKEARLAVDRARRSNRSIIFEMGHHSIAEHAVFNFDILGISRRAVEELEHFRLCSYTEKSQRYVTLGGDYIIPEEVKKVRLQHVFKNTVSVQNRAYMRLFGAMRDHLVAQYRGGAPDQKAKRMLENGAKEDARYVLSLATQTQLGATVNARNLELIIRRCASHPLVEMQELGLKLYRSVKQIAPSIILFHHANEYDQKTYQELKYYVRRFKDGGSGRPEDNVMLVDATPDADTRVLTALLFTASSSSYRDALRIVRKMKRRQKVDLFKKACQHMELFDVALREFECAQLTYALIVSAGCFGQLKRHRIATLVCQKYDPSLGYTLPELVQSVGEEKRFRKVMELSELCYQKIEKKAPAIGSYILTNAHRRRVLMSFNLRELYHISRLREDSTAQWDIRQIAAAMSQQAQNVMPICTLLLGAKETFPAAYKRLFGRDPRVITVPEP